MSRIAIPSIESAPAAAQPLLDAVKQQLGVVPNMFRLIANSPAGLEGYLSLSGALGKGALNAQTRERIALAVAQANGCDYCMSAHSYLAANLAKLDDAEIAANRRGGSNDARAAAAVRFAVKIVEQRGHVASADLEAVRAAGYADAEIVEIVLHVALNTLTNYINSVAKTDIDFTVIQTRSAAA